MLILQLEDAIATIVDKEHLVRDTMLVKAVSKPIESISDLSVPGLVLLPTYFLNVSQQIKSKVHR